MKTDSSPISKVVKLITEMKATAEKEAATDEESNDKYNCWCETNEKEKTAAIKDGEENVEELTSFVEEASGTSAKLETEIEGLKSDIGEIQEALAAANEVREKESEEFQAGEADMKETIDLLTQAISKLKEVQLMQKRGHKMSAEQEDDALVQVNALVNHVRGHRKFKNVLQRDLFEVLGSIQEVARHEVKKHGSSLAANALLGEVFLSKKDDGTSMLEALSADPNPNKLKGAAAGAKSYNAKSGQILGIMEEMKDEFQRDLAKAQKEDLTALVDFQKLTAAKSSELAASTKQKEMKEGQLADLLSKVAESKENIKSTQEAIDADSDFLARLKKNCKSAEIEYHKRVKVREEEIKALAATLEILTDTEARAVFSKTVAFLQVGTSVTSKERLQEHVAKKAMQRLMKVGRKHNNIALISLAVRVRLDSFGKVKLMLDKMMAELKKQQAEEYNKKDECDKEIDETEDDIKEATETKEDLTEKLQDTVNTLSELKASSDELKKEVAEMEVELKKAGEARKAENQLYQTSISDQRATVAILEMAYGKLKAFYASSPPSPSFAQTGAPGVASSPEPETQEYSRNNMGGSVMQLIAKIITDAESEEAELATSEANAQKNYAEFVQDTSNSIDLARKAIAEKEKQAAKAKSEKAETEEALLANKGELEKMTKLLQATHAGCDFILKYFDLRQKARAEEMGAISDAKAILSGANYGK
jgi:chromosome segregation ATPase